MPCYRKETVIPGVSTEDLWNWHMRPGAFERLLPPWQRMDVVRFPSAIEEGAIAEFKLRMGPLGLPWRARHHTIIPGREFTDTAEGGPFAVWHHRHLMEPTTDGATLIDEVTWEAPLKPLGRWAAGWFIEHELETLFRYRHRRTARDLLRHRTLDWPRPLTVAITGASGLVGRALSSFLTTGGHRVLAIGRRARGPDGIQWNPATGELDPTRLEGVDAVVHLAGESISGSRWTAEKKRRILESRVQGTALMARTLASLERPPSVFISGSAIGFYGHGPEMKTEAEPHGSGFLADVGTAWEAAAQPARDAGIRVVHPRIGLVMVSNGGLLGTLLPMFQWGMGGVVGGGHQGMSWIDLQDLVGLLAWCIRQDNIEGPVNAVAPTPVDNATFVRTLGQTLWRPTLVPAPALAVKLLMGEQGDALALQGQYVTPEVATRAGFIWDVPDLAQCLGETLGRR
ncbi:MAG: TIGR01777 family oxidoreductase [Myxococcota bacterium]